jgi:hypothetical protein
MHVRRPVAPSFPHHIIDGFDGNPSSRHGMVNEPNHDKVAACDGIARLRPQADGWALPLIDIEAVVGSFAAAHIRVTVIPGKRCPREDGDSIPHYERMEDPSPGEETPHCVASDRMAGIEMMAPTSMAIT